MAGLSPESSPGPLPATRSELQHLDGFEASTLLQPLEAEEEEAGGDRYYPRLVAPPCRPVMVRIESQSEPSSWFCADILDISLGGLCLLIAKSHEMEVGDAITVDFKAHQLPASFGGDTCLAATLRWFVHSGFVTTMGIGFTQPMQELPVLLSERRHQSRDPNVLPELR